MAYQKSTGWAALGAAILLAPLSQSLLADGVSPAAPGSSPVFVTRPAPAPAPARPVQPAAASAPTQQAGAVIIYLPAGSQPLDLQALLAGASTPPAAAGRQPGPRPEQFAPARPSGPALLPQPRPAAPAPAPGLPAVGGVSQPPQWTPHAGQATSFVTNPPPRVVPASAPVAQPPLDASAQSSEPRQRALIPASSLPLKINESESSRGFFEWPEGMRAKPEEAAPAPQSPIAQRTRAIFRALRFRSLVARTRRFSRPLPRQPKLRRVLEHCLASATKPRSPRRPRRFSRPRWRRPPALVPMRPSRHASSRTRRRRFRFSPCLRRRSRLKPRRRSKTCSLGTLKVGPCLLNRSTIVRRFWRSRSRFWDRTCYQPIRAPRGRRHKQSPENRLGRRNGRGRRRYSPNRYLPARSLALRPSPIRSKNICRRTIPRPGRHGWLAQHRRPFIRARRPPRRLRRHGPGVRGPCFRSSSSRTKRSQIPWWPRRTASKSRP